MPSMVQLTSSSSTCSKKEGVVRIGAGYMAERVADLGAVWVRGLQRRGCWEGGVAVEGGLDWG